MTTSLNLTPHEISTINNRIIEAIEQVFQNSSTEPYLVAELNYKLPELLNSINLERIKFKSVGIFIHQKPYVKNISNDKFNSKTCELGDLLLINNLSINNNKNKRTALLLQAKRCNIMDFAKPDNKTQWNLYTNWPTFKYVRTPLLNDQERYIDRLKEKDIYNGAKYLLLDKSKSHKKHSFLKAFVAKSTQPELSNFNLLSTEIFDFIIGNAGKEFDLTNIDYDIGWNKIIYDVISRISRSELSESFHKIFHSTQNATRGQGPIEDILYFSQVYNYLNEFKEHHFVSILNKPIEDTLIECKKLIEYIKHEYIDEFHTLFEVQVLKSFIKNNRLTNLNKIMFTEEEPDEHKKDDKHEKNKERKGMFIIEVNTFINIKNIK